MSLSLRESSLTPNGSQAVACEVTAVSQNGVPLTSTTSNRVTQRVCRVPVYPRQQKTDRMTLRRCLGSGNSQPAYNLYQHSD